MAFAGKNLVTKAFVMEFVELVGRAFSPQVISAQGGITCEAIDEPRKSSKAIDKRVIINFCNKNVVSARFRDKNEAFILLL